MILSGPASFNTNSAIMNAYDNNLDWYEQTTAIGGGMTLGAQQLDTNDAVPDAMIVITDGWDGDLAGKNSKPRIEIKISSAAIIGGRNQRLWNNNSRCWLRSKWFRFGSKEKTISY